MPHVMPTPRELQALKVLWRVQRATVRDLYHELAPDEGELAYTTVLSLLQTMEQKGLVGRESQGKAHVYFPKLARERTCQLLAGSFLDQVFDGAMGEYVCRALESRPPSYEELEELEKLIAQAKRAARKGGKG